jgi:hypothetical protein
MLLIDFLGDVGVVPESRRQRLSLKRLKPVFLCGYVKDAP